MKTRILSIIIMLIISVPLLILGGRPFAIFLTVLSVMGLYELINIRESEKKFPFLVKVFAYLLVIFYTLSNFNSIYFSYTMDYRVMSFIIFAFLIPLIVIKDKDIYSISDALFLIGSVLFIGLSFNLMIIIRNFDIRYIAY